MGDKRRRKIAEITSVCASSCSLSGIPPFRFLCPICEQQFDTSDLQNITDGHIIPQAAGGKMSVLICKPCNSRAGSDIDKWFGEHMRLSSQKLPIFASKQIRNVAINGVPVGADIAISDAGSIDVTIHEKHTSPACYKAMFSALQTDGPRKITMEVPLLAHRRSVFLGALQAGYLAFVKAFGYVPVFQRSWDIVRLQLANFEKDILPKQFAGIANGQRGNAIGLARIDGRTCAYAAFFDLVVFFPPAVDDGTFYEKLPADYPAASIQVYPLSGQGPQEFAPCALIVDREFVIWPTKLWTINPSTLIAHYDSTANDLSIFQQGGGEYTTDPNFSLMREGLKVDLRAPLAPWPVNATVNESNESGPNESEPGVISTP